MVDNQSDYSIVHGWKVDFILSYCVFCFWSIFFFLWVKMKKHPFQKKNKKTAYLSHPVHGRICMGHGVVVSGPYFKRVASVQGGKDGSEAGPMHFCVHLRPQHAHLRRQTQGRLRALCMHADASCPPQQKRHGPCQKFERPFSWLHWQGLRAQASSGLN